VSTSAPLAALCKTNTSTQVDWHPISIRISIRHIYRNSTHCCLPVLCSTRGCYVRAGGAACFCHAGRRSRRHVWRGEMRSGGLSSALRCPLQWRGRGGVWHASWVGGIFSRFASQFAPYHIITVSHHHIVHVVTWSISQWSRSSSIPCAESVY
jgi:hypothetical protein